MTTPKLTKVYVPSGPRLTKVHMTGGPGPPGPPGGYAGFEWVFDGGGADLVIDDYSWQDYIVPFKCQITAATVIAQQSTPGSIVIGIWRKPFPGVPTLADSIAASARPTLSNQINSQDTTLAGWSTVLNENDVLRANIDSVGAGLKKVLCALTVLQIL